MFTCHGCPIVRSFSSASCARMHRRSHVVSHAMCMECGYSGIMSLTSMIEHYYKCKGNCCKCGKRFGRVSDQNEFQALIDHQRVCTDFSGFRCGISNKDDFMSPARHFYYKPNSGKNNRVRPSDIPTEIPHPKFLSMLPNTLSEGKLQAMFDTFGSKPDSSLGHLLSICSGSYTCGCCDATAVQ